jgi:hypothetical protein
LRTAFWVKDRSERDLSVWSANEGLRPSMPGYLQTIWGQSARSTGTLAEAFGVVPLEPGMVDTSSNLPVVTIPRLSAGPTIRVREDVGSGTLTVRVQAVRDLAVLVKNATAVAKVTGLTPPSGF